MTGISLHKNSSQQFTYFLSLLLSFLKGKILPKFWGSIGTASPISFMDIDEYPHREFLRTTPEFTREELDMIKPDPNCPLCHGQGFINKQSGSTECDCMLKARLIEYLSPRYCNSKMMKMTVNNYSCNLLFEDFNTFTFNSFVRSFLILSWTKVPMNHKTVCGFDIADAYFSQHDKIQELRSIDFLIIDLGYDSKNDFYSEVIGSLLQSRSELQKMTWINSRFSVETEMFSKKYQDLGQFLLHEIHPNFRKVSPTKGVL